MSSSGLLRKKETITIKQPIPGFIPLQLALDVLHDHSGVITMNPLVIGHKPRPPPRDAPADEYHCTWYEISERIQYVPGLGKMGSGKIHFNGCFHSTTWGLQTHIYAPMNIDMRTDYKVVDAGQPGSTTGARTGLGGMVPIALGTEQPVDKDTETGLYLRADIRFECNMALVSFVRSQCQSAIKEMVARMVKKAEVLDADVLAKMFKDTKPYIGDDVTPPKKEFAAVELPGSYDFDENSLGNLQLSGKRQTSQQYLGQQYHIPGAQTNARPRSYVDQPQHDRPVSYAGARPQSYIDQSHYSQPVPYVESELPAELPLSDEPKPPVGRPQFEQSSNGRPKSSSGHQLYDRPVSYAEQLPYQENQLPYQETQLPYKENRLPYQATQLPYKENQLPHQESQLPYKENQPYHNKMQLPYEETRLPYKENQLAYQRPQNHGERYQDDEPRPLFNGRASYGGLENLHPATITAAAMTEQGTKGPKGWSSTGPEYQRDTNYSR